MITACINSPHDLEHEFFSYLPMAEKDDLNSRIKSGISILVAFYDDAKLKCFAIFDFDVAAVHINQVCGNFGKLWRKIEAFAEGLAMHLQKPAITLCTNRRAVTRLALQNGYSHNQYGDLEKVLI